MRGVSVEMWYLLVQHPPLSGTGGTPDWLVLWNMAWLMVVNGG